MVGTLIPILNAVLLLFAGAPRADESSPGNDVDELQSPQACDERQCYLPEQVDFELPIDFLENVQD